MKYPLNPDGWLPRQEWPKKGDRIVWRRDHLGTKVKAGVVVACHEHGNGKATVYALPDVRNHGLERDGGTSEIHDLADIRDPYPGEDVQRLPDLRFDFYLVPHGYQVNVYIDVDRDNKKLIAAGGSCRDFADSYNVAELREDLSRRLAKTIADWRSGK